MREPELNREAGTLRPVPPFDWARSVAFLDEFAPTRHEQNLTALTLTKAVRVPGQTVAFRLHGGGTVEEPELAYTLFSDEPITPEVKEATTSRIRFFLSLDEDLKPFYAVGRTDRAFAPLIEKLYGYHQVKFLTPFENACWAVLSQRNPLAVARRAKQSLVEAVGNVLQVEGARLWAFPEPAQMIGLSQEELNEVISNERKAESLRAVTAAFAQVDEQWLRTGPYEKVEEWLLSIKGIGPWSAAFVLVRGLGRVESLPGEARLLEAASRAYRQPSLTQAQLEKLAAPYSPWAGYWAHYLRVGA